MLQDVADDPGEIEGAVENATHILTGQDEDYAPMGPWNAEGIGNWIRGHMNGVPEEGGAASAVRYALTHLAIHQLELQEMVADEALDARTAGRRIQSLVTNWVKLLLGVPEMGVPDQRSERRL